MPNNSVVMEGASTPHDLKTLGWSPDFARHFEPFASQGLVPARVGVQHNRIYRLYTPSGEVLATTAGRLHHHLGPRPELPVVGDWVVIRLIAGEVKGRIEAVLPRKSKFARRMAGGPSGEQVVAANIDLVFLVSGLDRDFNLRRVERYLTLAREGGADPVILLNKADVADDLPAQVAAVAEIAGGVPIHSVSAARREGLDVLQEYFTIGRTVALLGSSGVGKSTLINALLGSDVLTTRAVRLKDDRGRHTTTRRELIVLPGGGLVMDTPGMRELQLVEADEGLQDSFDDIETLAGECRFRDCRHLNEPGCAVKQAVADGSLSEARLNNYQKLQKELGHAALQQDRLAQLAEKKRIKALMRAAEKHKPRE